VDGEDVAEEGGGGNEGNYNSASHWLRGVLTNKLNGECNSWAD
jgi:hypothetical protein